MCSGDKLVGGSQAGLMLGRQELVRRLQRHPLSRALRPDKLQLAVLEETLLRYAIPGRLDEIPVWRMLRLSPEALRQRSAGWAEALAADGISAEVVPLQGAVGGGTTPGPPLSSFGMLLRSRHPGRLRRQLVQSDPPVVGLERADGVAIDARCVLPGEDEELLAVIRACLKAAS